jgi:hypothetical protein
MRTIIIMAPAYKGALEIRQRHPGTMREIRGGDSISLP